MGPSWRPERLDRAETASASILALAIRKTGRRDKRGGVDRRAIQKSCREGKWDWLRLYSTGACPTFPVEATPSDRPLNGPGYLARRCVRRPLAKAIFSGRGVAARGERELDSFREMPAMRTVDLDLDRQTRRNLPGRAVGFVSRERPWDGYDQKSSSNSTQFTRSGHWLRLAQREGTAFPRRVSGLGLRTSLFRGGPGTLPAKTQPVDRARQTRRNLPGRAVGFVPRERIWGSVSDDDPSNSTQITWSCRWLRSARSGQRPGRLTPTCPVAASARRGCGGRGGTRCWPAPRPGRRARRWPAGPSGRSGRRWRRRCWSGPGADHR